MDAKSLIADAKQRMDASLETVRRELAAMRTGRALLAMLDGIKVDYYGTPTPLNQVGNLSVPEPTLIVIQPWEPQMVQPIEKADCAPPTRTSTRRTTASWCASRCRRSPRSVARRW